MRTAHWYERCRRFEKEAQRLKGSWLFLGDSLTEQFPLQRFFPRETIVNQGINGDHIDGVMERLPLCRALKPRAIWLMIGINDLFDGRSVENMDADYRLLFERMECGCPITVQSILPVGGAWVKEYDEPIKNANRVLRRRSAEYGFTWCDLYTPFKAALAGEERIFREDDIHLTDSAYRIWAEYINFKMEPPFFSG